MTISLRYDEYTVREGCHPALLQLIQTDPNCARSMLGKTWDEVVGPETTWHELLLGDKFVGAIMLDPPNIDAVCQHLYMLEAYKNRDNALVFTQLSVQITRMKGLVPYTTVLNIPEYEYMRKFLDACGFEKHGPLIKQATRDTYNVFLPTDRWTPPCLLKKVSN